MQAAPTASSELPTAVSTGVLDFAMSVTLGVVTTSVGAALVGKACAWALVAGARPAATEDANWPTTLTAKVTKAMVVVPMVAMTSRRRFVRN